MAASFVRSSRVLQNASTCGCQLGNTHLSSGRQLPGVPPSQSTIPLRKASQHTRPSRTLRIRVSEDADSKKEGGSTPFRAAPPRPGAAPPKLGAASPKPGAARPKMGPRPETGPPPGPAAPPRRSAPSADLPKPVQGPQPSGSGVVTSVKSPFGESSVKSPFGESSAKSPFVDAKPKSIFGDSDVEAKSPFGESGSKSGAAKPAGKRVKIGTGSGTLSPYGKSTTSARYKIQEGAYPGRLPPDFGDSGTKTTTKPSTFRPDSSLFAERSRIELKQEAKDAEKKWVITPGQIVLGLTFVFSIVLMLGTFYLVYKVGGIHFNE